MRGIFGWLGGAEQGDAADRARRMGLPFGTAHPTLESGPGGAAGMVGPRVSVYQERDLLLALAGYPTLEGYPNPASLLPAILELYRTRPERLPAALHGPFALAILEPGAQRALLAVDRLGIEPLCFAPLPAGLVFGSRADAVAAHPDTSGDLDPQGLYDYLYFHCIPAPQVVYRGQRKLLPGQWVRYQGGAVTAGFFWRMDYQDRPAAFEPLRQEFLDTLRHCVAAATAGQGRDEVGAFLSGGTDSSTVAGLLRELWGEPAQTFSIGFEAQGYDEMGYVEIAERHFGLDSRRYYVTPDDVLDAIPRLAAAYDEPFGNSSAIPALFCIHLARQHGIRTLLAGDGGDEIFGGNARYAYQLLFETYLGLPAGLRRRLEPLADLPGAARIPLLRKIASFIRQARVPLPDRMESYNFLHRTSLAEIFTPGFLAQVNPEQPAANLREVYQRAASGSALNRMLHLDMKITLADNDLRKVSRMGELADVEVRYPLLDEALVELSARVPPDLKIRRYQLRYFFKRALADFLPKEILRKRKHGFGLPAGLWLRDHPGLRQLAQQRLVEFKKRDIIRTEYLERLRVQHEEAHTSYYGTMVWVLLMLEEWLQAKKL